MMIMIMIMMVAFLFFLAGEEGCKKGSGEGRVVSWDCDDENCRTTGVEDSQCWGPLRQCCCHRCTGGGERGALRVSLAVLLGIWSREMGFPLMF